MPSATAFIDGAACADWLKYQRFPYTLATERTDRSEAKVTAALAAASTQQQKRATEAIRVAPRGAVTGDVAGEQQ